MRLLLIIPIIVICHHGILYETGQDKKISSLLFIIYLIRSIQLSLCIGTRVRDYRNIVCALLVFC